MPTAAQILQHNKKAWEREVQNGNPWTIPVTPEQIARARQGDFQLLLTSLRPIPPEWYPRQSVNPRIWTNTTRGE